MSAHDLLFPDDPARPSAGLKQGGSPRGDADSRFAKSRSVGAVLGMVPRKRQSGQLDRNGRITETGEASARSALFGAARVMLRGVKRKALAAKVARRL